MAGIRSGAGGPAYSASKAGVISLAQTAANELYGTGVRVNAIAPGLHDIFADAICAAAARTKTNA